MLCEFITFVFNVYFQILILQGISCTSQAAISIAKDIGCELFIAVNSREEAEQINAYNGLNIIDMSSTDIETHVLKQTRRAGVDFVFNSSDHKVSAIENSIRKKFNPLSDLGIQILPFKKWTFSGNR